MREEIEAGLKNGIERGSSMDEAIQSLINAGYNPVEVREAANNIGASGSTPMVMEQKKQPVSATQSMNSQKMPDQSQIRYSIPNPQNPLGQPIQQQMQQQTQIQQPEIKPKSRKTIIVLALLLLVLLLILVGLAFYAKDLLNLVSP